MLTLMGYRDTGNGTFTLDGPVDPDRVANVSRDSLVALVECQVCLMQWKGFGKAYLLNLVENVLNIKVFVVT